jgi:guanylate kinase
MSERKHGRLVVISGPSGAGKTSICEMLLTRMRDAVWSISVTTRERRGHEVDGREYRFISHDEFQGLIEADALIEHAQYLGKYYGTPAAPIELAVGQGRIVVMEIDVQGGAQVAEKAPDSLLFFILPPTMETLKARLEGRKTESEAIQRARLAKADGEIGFARSSGCYQFFITNDILSDSVDRVIEVINEESQTE